LSTLLLILSEIETTLQPQTNKKPTSLNKLIASRIKRPFMQHVQWKWYHAQYQLTPFRTHGLTTTTTKRIIMFNVKHYQSIMMYYWGRSERQFILKQIKEYNDLSTIRNYYEAEKRIEAIANRTAHVKIVRKNKSPIGQFIQQLEY
jgi:hypothetical protein